MDRKIQSGTCYWEKPNSPVFSAKDCKRMASVGHIVGQFSSFLLSSVLLDEQMRLNMAGKTITLDRDRVQLQGH